MECSRFFNNGTSSSSNLILLELLQLGGNDANGVPLSYDAGFMSYLNGVRMVNGTDVTVSSGNSIVLYLH